LRSEWTTLVDRLWFLPLRFRRTILLPGFPTAH
jgi:hypothetical protein